MLLRPVDANGILVKFVFFPFLQIFGSFLNTHVFGTSNKVIKPPQEEYLSMSILDAVYIYIAHVGDFSSAD